MEVLLVGSSPNNVKILNVGKHFIDGNFKIDRSNWVGYDTYGDTFNITIENGICRVQRTDSDGGWGMFLAFYIEKNPKECYDIIPWYFINLDKDTERLESFENMIYNITDKENVFRIPGVVNELGLEGCRLAHIDAHITAINQGSSYYIICEDDIIPIVKDYEMIKFYVNDSIKSKPDMVLFEQGGGLEKNIKMKKFNENLYQIFGCGNNTGCYLCSRNFGLELIRFWNLHQNHRIHIDHSWQRLWPNHRVFFNRPQLFVQKAGYSNQSDVDYRHGGVPFNWDLYESLSADK